MYKLKGNLPTTVCTLFLASATVYQHRETGQTPLCCKPRKGVRPPTVCQQQFVLFFWQAPLCVSIESPDPTPTKTHNFVLQTPLEIDHSVMQIMRSRSPSCNEDNILNCCCGVVVTLLVNASRRPLQASPGPVPVGSAGDETRRPTATAALKVGVSTVIKEKKKDKKVPKKKRRVLKRSTKKRVPLKTVTMGCHFFRPLVW